MINILYQKILRKLNSVKKGNILIYEFYKNSDTLKLNLAIYKSLIVFSCSCTIQNNGGSLNYEKISSIISRKLKS